MKSNGFSVVELMIVVALISILALIGIPKYKKFIAKARQSEAKIQLSGIFAAEAAFIERPITLLNVSRYLSVVRCLYKVGIGISVC